LWPAINANIYRGQRIALVGANGCGKSSLLKLIIGEQTPTQGQVKLGTGVKLGYFAQHQNDVLRPLQPVLGELRRLAHPKVKEEELRFALGLFLLGQEYWELQVGELSGGEKNRLLLASLFLNRANLLVLDEPTNHLDLESREALVQALSGYEGTILLVAHDRYLLSELAEEVWSLSPRGLEVLDPGLANSGLEPATGQEEGPARPQSRERSKDYKRRVAEARNALSRRLRPKQDRLLELERALEKGLEQQERLESRLADPDTYEQPEMALAVNREYAEICDWNEDLMQQMAELEQEISDLRQEQEALRDPGLN
jgi:ATP-binding cassette subfamily F protein 3